MSLHVCIGMELRSALEICFSNLIPLIKRANKIEISFEKKIEYYEQHAIKARARENYF